LGLRKSTRRLGEAIESTTSIEILKRKSFVGHPVVRRRLLNIKWYEKRYKTAQKN